MVFIGEFKGGKSKHDMHVLLRQPLYHVYGSLSEKVTKQSNQMQISPYKMYVPATHNRIV